MVAHQPEAAPIELPKFSRWRRRVARAITPPEKIYTPVVGAVLDELVERGPTARSEEDDSRLFREGLPGRMLRKAGVRHLEKIATSNP